MNKQIIQDLLVNYLGEKVHLERTLKETLANQSRSDTF